MTKLKVLLIEPPFYRLFNRKYSLDKYPLSLGYLAAAIKKNTPHEVMVYNSDFVCLSIAMTQSYLAKEGYHNYINNLNDRNYFLWNDIHDTIRSYGPDLVGITSKSQNYYSACIVASICKKFNKNILVVVGGPHVSMVGKEVLDCKDFDVAVKGEGEYTFIELINCFAEKKDFSNIAGLIFRDNGEIIAETPPREFVEDLDVLPSPYLYAPEVLKDFAEYPLFAFRGIFATRACPFNCIFCGSSKIWQHKIRYRSPRNVADEINLLRKQGLSYFNFDDDTFGITKKYIFSLCNMLKENCNGIHWSCEMHVNLITDDVLKAMKDAGCDLIKIGIESGNNSMLKKIQKNITVEDAMDAIKRIKKHKIHVMAFYMVGFPEETEETLRDTVKAIKNTPGSITYSIFTPYRGTAAYEIITLWV